MDKKIDILVLLFGEVSKVLSALSIKLLKQGKLSEDLLVKLTDYYTSHNLLIAYSTHKKNESKAIKIAESMTNIIKDFAEIEKKKKITLKDILSRIYKLLDALKKS